MNVHRQEQCVWQTFVHEDGGGLNVLDEAWGMAHVGFTVRCQDLRLGLGVGINGRGIPCGWPSAVSGPDLKRRHISLVRRQDRDS